MLAIKPLWHEGIVLTPQHFQLQEHWVRWSHNHLAAMTLAEPWGVIHVALDTAALTFGRLKVDELKLRLPDGSMIDTAAGDMAPPARDLFRDVDADVNKITVFACLPLLRAGGENCRLDNIPAMQPQRYFRDYVAVTDLMGQGVEQIAIERQAVRLLLDGESHAEDAVCAIAQLVRGADGNFVPEPAYVPPCLVLTAHPRHVERARRVADILLSKATALASRRSERIEQVAEFGVADVSLFWLLHCIQTHWPRLRFIATQSNQSPEALYLVLAELTGALMTFSTRHALSAIPVYDHRQQDHIFATMEMLVRELLDATIPSRVVVIGLQQQQPTTWTAQLLDERLNDRADYYLSVSASLPTLDLIEQIPRLCKLGAPDDVQHVVNVALRGITLKPVQRVPAAIPVRLENHYFALHPGDAALARMLAARACQVYLPTSITQASVELYAVLHT